MSFENILTLFMIIVAVFCAIVIILVIVDLIVEGRKIAAMKKKEDNIRYVAISEEVKTEEVIEETIEEVTENHVEEVVSETKEEVSENSTKEVIETNQPILPFITIVNKGRYTLKVRANVVGNDELSKTVVSNEDVVKVNL